MKPLAIGIAVGTFLVGGSAWAATVDLDWCLSGCGGPNTDATISVGDTLRWTWTDSLSHTVDSVTGPETFSSGLRTGVGSQFSHTFTQAGTSSYECFVHGIGLMGGTITVVALPPPAGVMAVSKTPNPTQVSPPAAMVIFTIRVDNVTGSTSSPASRDFSGPESSGPKAADPTALTLTSLTDSVFGDLNGQGDCVVPQTIATGGFYTCSFTDLVSGFAPSSHSNTVTAAGTFPGPPPIDASADASAVVEIMEPVPTLAFWWQVALLLLLAGIGAFLVSRRKLAR